MGGFLFDLPKSWFEQAVVTDGQFDPKKAEELGYNPAQFPAIEEFLGLGDKSDVPTPAPKNPHADED